MSNRLIGEKSPYLLQHAHNPVDWYPWCDEAFAKAALEDKPIFLSVGYSTCHWCHVMAHESFEDEDIAFILNKYFISIKVDREERPDIDSVYMAACQAVTGSGGWPMSVFLTPEQKPFYAGTYFPPRARGNMVGFRELLIAIADKWKRDKEALLESADRILAYLRTAENESTEKLGINLPGKAAELFSQSYDSEYGGFGSAPKFPMPHNLIFLILYAKIHGDKTAARQAYTTLDKMRRGGIFDHIGYGFSRYSTDAYYLVPHFEKMLYDNALLMIAYAAAYKESGDRNLLDTAKKTAEYVLREMTAENGAFYSAQDADSEGEEGKFYVWRYEEICEVLGKKKGQKFCEYFGITEEGNFEGRSIPNLLNGRDISDDLTKEKQMLYEHRKARGKLHLDDKILTSWNSLMICAFCVLYRVTGKKIYLRAAQAAQEFIEERLADGALLYVSFRDGKRSGKGFLDEYAYYTAALIALYEATAYTVYLLRARQTAEEAIRQFGDPDGGGYYLYGMENDSLITRPKETYDGALPSGNSVMAYCMVRLSQITGEESYRKEAEKQLIYMSGEAGDYPAGYSMFLTAFLLYLHPPRKITAVLAQGDSRETVMTRMPLYADVRILEKASEQYKLLQGKTTYYVCEEGRCLPPVNEDRLCEVCQK